MPQKNDKELFRFSTGWRTRFSEVDLQGVVHHSEIIKYLEVARVEYWRELGIDYKDFLATGLEFVIARVECDYIKPLYFDTLIRVMVRVAQVTRTSMTIEYLIYDDDGNCVIKAATILVCLKSGQGKPHPLPAAYLKRIFNFEIEGTVRKKAGMKL